MTTQLSNRKLQTTEIEHASDATSTCISQAEQSSGCRFLYAVAMFTFMFMMSITGNVFAQEAQALPMVQDAAYAPSTNIFNYTTVYNSGKVFVNWTAKDEPADCIYIVERSSDGRKFESVGVKEGIGTDLELFYSWMDHTPPAGFAYYRVKKITKDGSQLYSATNTIINQGSSFDQKSNYAKGANTVIDMK